MRPAQLRAEEGDGPRGLERKGGREREGVWRVFFPFFNFSNFKLLQNFSRFKLFSKTFKSIQKLLKLHTNKQKPHAFKS
jgi:hypothetical protein